jgi:hypothetical protein
MGATCRLLITCLTPGSDAAYFAAASRSASLSTVPDNVTAPFEAWTANCLFSKPESAASFDWMFEVTWESLGALEHATASPNTATSIAIRRNREILTFIGELLSDIEGFLPV